MTKSSQHWFFSRPRCELRPELESECTRDREFEKAGSMKTAVAICAENMLKR